jgi:PilZ domain
MEVTELRIAERFRTAEPLPGSFGSASVTLLDVSSSGAQIEHSQPLRIGTRGRLWFKRGELSVSVQATMLWSHLSKSPNEEGKYLYKSGMRLEAESRDFYLALRTLLDHGVLSPDRDSLERKKQRVMERLAEKNSRPTVKYLRPDVEIPADQQLMIEHARKQLLSDPLEAQRWYQRAKYAITHGGVNVAGDAIRNREDVLAVWEYLERSVEISTIALVFERARVNDPI